MNVTIPSSGNLLEGILWPSRLDPPTRVALICHPHPQYGGTMHNKVVFRAGRALQDLGLAVLRFNFRGAGNSTGRYDFGEGEKDDVRAALTYLHERYPQADITLAGYSFGAWVALRVGCQDDRVSHLISIGTPVATADFGFLVDCEKPKLFLHGTADEFGSVDQMEALLLSVPAPKDLVLIDGADHFFHSTLEALTQALSQYFPG